ncbi:hypothetical protein NZA98_32750, partial [Escherichia coli]|nr:hypothetical protein [Escherichia coli]
CSGLAGQALHENLGVFVDENGHTRPFLLVIDRHGAAVNTADNVLPDVASGRCKFHTQPEPVLIFELIAAAGPAAR